MWQFMRDDEYARTIRERHERARVKVRNETLRRILTPRWHRGVQNALACGLKQTFAFKVWRCTYFLFLALRAQIRFCGQVVKAPA